MRARWMVVGLVVLFAFALSFAEEHYVCKKVGDLDKWGVPRWKQEKLFSNGVVIYIDIYKDHAEIKAEENNTPLCICKDANGLDCEETCGPECTESCDCPTCITQPDGTWVAKKVNEIVNVILKSL